MTGFEPRISGISSDRSANLAKTTAQDWFILEPMLKQFTIVIYDYYFK